MSTILTCTDGSPYAPSIYQHSAWAAKQLNGKVQVLHILEHHRERSDSGDLTGAIGIDASVELTEELARLEEVQGRVALLKGRGILEEARQQLMNLGVVDVSLTQRHGTVVETLQEFENQAALIVLGKRGEHAGSRRSPLGSNLEEAVRVSSRPVLVASRMFRPINKFLIAFDNSASARKAVAFVAESKLLKGLSCHLLMVGRASANQETALDCANEELVSAGYKVKGELVPGNGATGIAEKVQSENIDLVVMGAYGHSHIREFMVGSTTTKVVRSCIIPVLLFSQ